MSTAWAIIGVIVAMWIVSGWIEWLHRKGPP